MWKFSKNIDEAALIQGCINNDRKYQQALYELYFEKMLRLCKRYSEDQEEQLTILNNGFLKVYLNLSKFKKEGSFEGWIRRIMYRSVADFFRNKHSKVKFMELDDTLYLVTSDNNTLDTLFKEDILKILETLPDTTMRIFVMYVIEGFSHKEIGNLVGIPENTSKWHLSNAKKILKEQLSDFYYQDNSKDRL